MKRFFKKTLSDFGKIDRIEVYNKKLRINTIEVDKKEPEMALLEIKKKPKDVEVRITTEKEVVFIVHEK